MAKDPLGRRPTPITGKRIADFANAAVQERDAAMRRFVKTIWVDHKPQERVIGQILAYRLASLDGESDIDGLCLSQDSQVGKTATAKRVKHVLAMQSVAKGEEVNPYQVIVVGLDKKTSLKSVLQDILIEMKDPDWDYGTEKQLRQRILAFRKRLGVELIFIDECQHLKKDGNDVADVTDAFKRFLDMGIAPLVLIGNLDAENVFNRNPQFRARLGKPLKLTALNMKRTADAIHFKNFVSGYDQALAAPGGFGCLSGLTSPATLDALEIVSGGFFGRVARIIQNAAIHAAARGALRIEAYDLSCIVRDYAVPSKWTSLDPFSSPYA